MLSNLILTKVLQSKLNRQIDDIRIEQDLSQVNRTDPNALNNAPDLIIRKENFGSESYQQQNYQYNLLNNLRKREHYYEDLTKMRDRFQKPVPTMQQVIHVDMKRVKINKIYERKLEQNLAGPRGLNWQHKQTLQRLRNTERDLAKDLSRLKGDLNRIDLPLDVDSSKRTTNSAGSSPKVKQKSFRCQNRRTTIYSNDDETFLHHQAQLIEQEKREIEQKLREFFM